MIVYSKKVIRFIKEIKSIILEVLSKEICARVAKDRFYNQRQDASYPIKVVIYNNKSMLGYFDSNFYELGFHECLMQADKKELENVIKHELAHYFTFIHHGGAIQPHGVEFKTFCLQMGWGEEVSKATSCLGGGRDPAKEENGIYRKIKKLMALSTSSNRNEAEQAMIKSRQLLLKHNLESIHNDSEESDERIFLKRIMKQKRENMKMRAIAKILETFFVSTVYNRAGNFTYLEILGNAVNIEIAEYVASFLHWELDNLWDQAQVEASLKGKVAKNSFFLGLAKGYCNKIQALKREYHRDVEQGVMLIERSLINAKAMIYQNLSSTKRRARYCGKSAALGERMGRQLHIKPAINRSTHSKTLIAYG